MGGLKLSEPGKYTSVAVMIDHYTKMVHLEPCPEKPTASKAAEIFVKRVVCTHGLSSLIITDRGIQFESLLWQQLWTLLNVQVRLASPQYPQSNGQVERVNRVVIQVIKTLLEESLEKWVTYLLQIEFAINNSPHTTTKESPHYLNYFRHPITPVIVNNPVLSTLLKTTMAAPERAELH